MDIALGYFAMAFWCTTGVFGAIIFWLAFIYLINLLLGFFNKKEEDTS